MYAPRYRPGKMSLTMTVPLVVPSLFQSSTPSSPQRGSPAVKNSVPFTFVRLLVFESNELTSVVPAAVPSLFHKALPLVKNNVPFTFVRLFGPELFGTSDQFPS